MLVFLAPLFVIFVSMVLGGVSVLESSLGLVVVIAIYPDNVLAISKQLWTHLAQPYPKTFGAVAGKALVNSFQNMRTFHLKQVYGN